MTDKLHSALHGDAARNSSGQASQGQKADGLQSTEDDGINAKERRRQQNRIAQRNHRQRKATRQNVSSPFERKSDVFTGYCQHCGRDGLDSRALVSIQDAGSKPGQTDNSAILQGESLLLSPLVDIDSLALPEGEAFEAGFSTVLTSDLPDSRNPEPIDDRQTSSPEPYWPICETLATSPSISDSLKSSQAYQHPGQGISGGQLALHLAAQRGFSSIVRLLLRKGAQVNAIDGRKKTALHYAAEAGHVETTEVLLLWGADTAIMDSSGLTSLHVAVSNGHEPIVVLLINAGADLNHPSMS